MLVTLNEVLPAAKRDGYAVGLFNTTNLEMATGVLAAAEEAKSPVIIGTAEVLLPSADLRELCDFLIPMAKRATVPVVVHFDHGVTEGRIFEALKLGCSSIMYDCSTCGYEENIARVAEMAKIAHGFGATIEAELGHVGANAAAAEGGAGDHSIYTDPAQAREYAEKTGVDALAVAIGNAHGAYRDTPRLDIGILREIAGGVKCPLVLHGGSGLSDDDFRNCIKNGISKVNIFTDINCAAAAAVARDYRPGMGICELSPAMADAVREETLKKMTLFGSVGRA